MATIGLLGGMSWESTAVYYRLLNERARAARGGLHSADILLRSLDFEQVVALQKADDWDGAATLLADAARTLEQAGADCVLICTNTMHIVAPQVAAALTVPLIDIIDATGAALAAAGKRRPLLLATRYTMEGDFYRDALTRRYGLAPMIPDDAGRTVVHAAIFDELCQGLVRPETRARLQAIIAQGQASGADSVILGCTELGLSIGPADSALPLFETVDLHVAATLAALAETGSGGGNARAVA